MSCERTSPAPTLPLPNNAAPEADGPAALPLADKLTVSVDELHAMTGLGVRTLRRLDASRDIPGRFTVGRRVLFQTAVIRAWVAAGCPGHKTWEAMQKAGDRRRPR